MISSSRVFRVVRFGARNKCKKIVEYWWWKKSCTSWHSEYLFFSYGFVYNMWSRISSINSMFQLFLGLCQSPSLNVNVLENWGPKFYVGLNVIDLGTIIKTPKNVVFFTKTTCQIEAPPNSWTWSIQSFVPGFFSVRGKLPGGLNQRSIRTIRILRIVRNQDLLLDRFCVSITRPIWDPPIRTHLKKMGGCFFTTSLPTKNQQTLTKETHPQYPTAWLPWFAMLSPGVSRSTSGAGWCGTIGWRAGS